MSNGQKVLRFAIINIHVRAELLSVVYLVDKSLQQHMTIIVCGELSDFSHPHLPTYLAIRLNIILRCDDKTLAR